MKRLSILILILFSTVYLFAQEDSKDIRFAWGIIYRNENGEIKLADIENDVRLNQNEKFKFYLKPDNSTYLYLFYLSSEGELTVLFPDKNMFHTYSRGAKSDIYIPASTEWFLLSLDDPDAADKVYLLASSKKIKELDVLIKKFIDYTDKSRLENSDDIKDKIIQKIILTIKEHSQFVSYSVKPTSTAGGTRSVPVEGYYQEISAKDFYARIFEIKY